MAYTLILFRAPSLTNATFVPFRKGSTPVYLSPASRSHTEVLLGLAVPCLTWKLSPSLLVFQTECPISFSLLWKDPSRALFHIIVVSFPLSLVDCFR